jgi:hypothetical protein
MTVSMAIFNTNIFGKNARQNLNNATYQRVFNETNTEKFNAIKSLSWNNILNETNDAKVAYEFLEMFTTFKIQRFICANNDT